jgi:hypothetical protein
VIPRHAETKCRPKNSASPDHEKYHSAATAATCIAAIHSVTLQQTPRGKRSRKVRRLAGTAPGFTRGALAVA